MNRNAQILILFLLILAACSINYLPQCTTDCSQGIDKETTIKRKR